jgi:hypothetical protein
MATGMRIAILMETVILFGPATLVLFLSPIGLIAALDSTVLTFVTLAGMTFGGAVGLYCAISLAAHSMDSDHTLPSRKFLSFGLGAGFVACVLALTYSLHDNLAIVVFGGPMVGAIHLLWINRRHFQHVA